MTRIVGYGVTWVGLRVTDDQGYDMIFFGIVLVLGGATALIVMCRVYGARAVFQIRLPSSPARGRGDGRSGADRRSGRQAQARRAERPAPVRQTGARPVPVDKAGRPVPVDKAGRPVPVDKAGRPVPVRKAGRPVPVRNGGRPAQGRPEVHQRGRPEAPSHRADVPEPIYRPPVRPGTIYRSTRPDGPSPPEARHLADDRQSRGAPHQIPNAVPPRRRSAPTDQHPPEP
jgi:hypothetical protein